MRGRLLIAGRSPARHGFVGFVVASVVVIACANTAPASATVPLHITDFSASVLGPGKALDTRAGGHPDTLVTSFDVSPSEDIKQVVIDAPAGLVVNPQAAPLCPLSDLANLPAKCSPATQIGSLDLRPVGQGEEFGLPIYNIVPEQGYPAEFGVFETELSRTALLYPSVRSGSDYGGRVISAPFPRALPIEGVTARLFGNPALQDNSGGTPLPLLSNPSDCSAGSFTATLHVDTWQRPGRFNADGTPDFSDPNWQEAKSVSPPVTGCEALRFSPTISVQPTTARAGAPSGLSVDLRFPQSADPNGLATPPLKDVTVTLPPGMAVSPSSADALEACSDAQIAVASAAPGSCPPGSQIGTVQIHTPLLADPLQGQIFLGTPLCSPCTDADAREGRMLRLFIQAQGAGVVVKLPGRTAADPSTGQLTASFLNNPQQPVDDVTVKLKEGPRAPLVTPDACGTYTSTAELSPWSTPFTADAALSSAFDITACASPSQFAPTFSAGSARAVAATFSPFVLEFSRQDEDQQLAGISLTLPPGLLARLAGVRLCDDASANAGSCPPDSRVGAVTVGAGPGSHPLFLPGQVYLTGPYNGGPYGLAVVVPAVAGPFNLGNVVVRQSLRIDPHTAQASVVSDPFPTIRAGVPLRLRTVRATIDRTGFTVNPTSCSPMRLAATLTSTHGQSVGVGTQFQVGGCRELGFAPSFAVATQGATSKANGASLRVRISASQGPRSNPDSPGEANIRRVAVSLPKLLPSRLSTLQKACPEAQFASNPGGCPQGAFVGVAVAHTPLLSGPLSGPAVLVSHGGAAFPDLVLVLQGEGVRLDLVGNTQITRGITFSRFETVPDAPISSFELTLPRGKYSALAAGVRGTLCGKRLLMPTTLEAQDGAVLQRVTRISLLGCPAAHRAKHTKRSRSNANRGARQRRRR
jgi:hypothetical protein